MRSLKFALVFILFFSTRLVSSETTPPIDLTRAVILADVQKSPKVVSTAVQVLIEEVGKRTGISLPLEKRWPEDRPVIALVCAKNHLRGKRVPEAIPHDPESFRIYTDLNSKQRPIVWIIGADGRGVLFGVGYLLRQLDWRPNNLILHAPIRMFTRPAYPIRGHQLGFRDVANSYDAWDEKQYEQYIRELAFWGTNCIENIPTQGDASPVMKRSRDEMNRAISEICARYDLDYWAWIPVTIDLNDQTKREECLEQNRRFFEMTPRLDHVFVPGGDPGNNPPELLLPFLEDLAPILQKYHPHAHIWLSLQGFTPEEAHSVYSWVSTKQPTWFGGLVSGPSSPPIPEARANLPAKYKHRHYPDITHNVRAQYPVFWWDPAFAFTLGREASNPRPVFYALIHNLFAPYTDGFLTYSDGAHDDVNKVIWSARGWDPSLDVRRILIEYARVFWGENVAERAADGILALERNWEGPAAQNGGIDATLALWREMEQTEPQLADNWRWQLCLLRAYYDAYVRHRLIHETQLETEANQCLLTAEEKGSGAAMDAALAVLSRAESGSVCPEWRDRILALCAKLYESIGLQTSTTEYHALNPQRGAILDFLDLPLNNRWWLEDEMAKVRTMSSEKDKVARLREIALWENPVPGATYDDIGNVAKSPHVVPDPPPSLAMPLVEPSTTGCMWWDNGKPRCRQSWVTYMDWPSAMRYTALDPSKKYVIRTTGYGQCLLRIDGELVTPVKDGKGIGEIKEFVVPQESYQDREITLTFDVPYEPGVNWRYTSRLTEVWLIPQP
ncbi:MAG TPA: hypothetical protein PKY35_03405 [Candidatus Hydrogenedentes bacterium]|nr:hypothetical protein [Candidatus Hydrogenedentota bacterium]HOL76051.1 hypothetical protein [Candidatus Hydrogenedentota bacterium]HPO84665.1 hypothetical protein [Candidatus Hydrogenedentota bacterium]